jgi:uncharacterized membrane protein YkvA (DUF1232 family)
MESRSSRIWPWCGIVIGTLYVLNPGAGLFELIPDVVPVVGNLDEVGATVLVVQSFLALRRARKERSALAPPERTRVEP